MSVRQETRYKKLVISQGRIESDRQRLLEAAFMERKQRPLVVPPKPTPTRREIRKWMRINAEDYETATRLAEAANVVFNLPCEWLDDECHWIWDEASDAHGIGDEE